MKIHDHGYRNWRSARDEVCCPSCGEIAIDTGLGSRPRWKCAGACPFAAGWRLEFADMENPDNSQMIAVPIGDDTGAVPWPRH